jgi:hypothetical protein
MNLNGKMVRSASRDDRCRAIFTDTFFNNFTTAFRRFIFPNRFCSLETLHNITYWTTCWRANNNWFVILECTLAWLALIVIFVETVTNIILNVVTGTVYWWFWFAFTVTVRLAFSISFNWCAGSEFTSDFTYRFWFYAFTFTDISKVKVTSATTFTSLTFLLIQEPISTSSFSLAFNVASVKFIFT